MKLQRYAGNPILSPHPAHPWEDLAVFNPAAWYDKLEPVESPAPGTGKIVDLAPGPAAP